MIAIQIYVESVYFMTEVQLQIVSKQHIAIAFHQVQTCILLHNYIISLEGDNVETDWEAELLEKKVSCNKQNRDYSLEWLIKLELKILNWAEIS